jgi:hypothetical protein
MALLTGERCSVTRGRSVGLTFCMGSPELRKPERTIAERIRFRQDRSAVSPQKSMRGVLCGSALWRCRGGRFSFQQTDRRRTDGCRLGRSQRTGLNHLACLFLRCIRGKTCANAGAVVWGSNEFNPGCFEGSLNLQQRRRSAWRYAVALFQTHQRPKTHPREFRKSVRRPSKSGSGTSNLDTRQH